MMDDIDFIAKHPKADMSKVDRIRINGKVYLAADKIKVKTYTLERYPKNCDECPFYSMLEYHCHNEYATEEVCALGYGAERGIRDGMDLFQYCTIKEDERVLTERRLIRNG